jgi:DNA-binding XRE family transcriptional regulator
MKPKRVHTKRLDVRLTEDIKASIKAHCKSKGMPQTVWVSRALLNQIEQEKMEPST